MDLNATPDVGEFFEAASNARKADKSTREGALARMEVYLEWLLTPKDVRAPRLKKEIADLLDVSTNTLLKYDHDPWLRREYIKRSRVAFTVSRASDVIETLYRRATDDTDPQGVAAARTLMTYMQAQDEREEGDSVDLSTLTAKDLLNLAKELEKQERAEQG